MKSIAHLIVAAFVLAPTLTVLAEDATKTRTFVFDPAHSTIGFKVGHFFGKVPGRFTEFDGTATIDETNPEKSSVTVTIKTASIDTSNKDRDKHLRSPDFFNVDKNPTATFQSKSVKRTGETTADVTGAFTLNGVTKEITLPIIFKGKLPDMRDAQLLRTAWEGSTKINRTDYGLAWNKLVEGVSAVGETVEIELYIEAVEKKS
jgi:polyisoprenoid-binding protein YceI